MKFRKLLVVMLAALLAFFSTGAVSAQVAYTTAFTTSITFSNVGSGAASITVTYYNENNGSGTAVNQSTKLAPGASGSIAVGSVDLGGSTFKGSAVLSSDQPIVATLVQVPNSTVVKNRPLSNGFQAGASRVLLATVLKAKFNTTTVFSVQNAGSAAANFTVKLYNADNPSAAAITLPAVASLPVGATKYFDMGTTSQVPAGFNGSAVIEGTGVTLVATAMELSTNGRAASAFEGVTGGSAKVFMPTALCAFLVSGQPANSAYAIQNVGTVATVATVTFNYPSGTKTFKTPSIAPNAKFSVQGCNGGAPNGSSGSAVIDADTAGASLVAIGKVTGAGISSAFLGQAAGAPKLSLPYVRWSESQYTSGALQRTFIAIQNVGGALAANSIKVRFYNAAGTLVGTYTKAEAVAANAKFSIDPRVIGAAGNEFGYTGGFGGGVQIEGPAGSQLLAVARVQSFVPSLNETVGEDYNGIPIQ